MNKTKSILATLALAGATFGAGMAQAADISQTSAISLTNGTNYFGRVLDINNDTNTFSDRYEFSATSALNLAAGVLAITPGVVDGIEITGLTLFNSAGLSLAGTSLSSGLADVWTVSTSGLVPDSYYLLVTGSVLSDAAISYAGTLTVSAVPEPETYGMLLAGLGLVGYMARRRRNKA